MASVGQAASVVLARVDMIVSQSTDGVRVVCPPGQVC